MKRGVVLVATALLLAAVIGAGFVMLGDGVSNAPSRGDPAEGAFYLRHACGNVSPEWARYLHRGWNPGAVRAWDLAAVPHQGSWFGSFRATSHSGPYDFLQEVPLVFYGPGFVRPLGAVTPAREVTLADLPETYARWMHFGRFPDRTGSPITAVMEPATAPPKLIVTVVIDGGGWNVLNLYPDAWPNLRRLMDEGASIENAVVGSSPSITPAIHTNLSTGDFPRRHGVMAIVARADDGRIVSGFADQAFDQSPQAADPTVSLDSTTLADQWDLATGNTARVAMLAAQNFHLGMIGHGAALRGADKDIAVMTDLETGTWATNPRYFSLPEYVHDVAGPQQDLDRLDRADGLADGRWRGHEFGRIDSTPAYAAWQNRVFEAIVDREGFGRDETTDLFYINYKAPDAAGHLYNMIAPEQEDVLRSVDRALGRLVAHLDAAIGRRNYVLSVTADHGQTPLDGEGWAVNQAEVRADVESQFDDLDNGEPVMERTSTALYFMNRPELTAAGVTPEAVASWLSRYTIGDNVPAGRQPPKEFSERLDERVFAAVIPGRDLRKLVECSG